MSNGNKPEGQRRKVCPFLGKWCIGEECAIHAYLMRGNQRVLTCAFEAMVIMLSELNAKTPSPQQVKKPEIILPFMGRS